ncbi:MAG: hypothetical protein MUC50_22760 [Myxococcota bacterium]|jgi:hypothetical protein|nr:hypothetical protein [Myxococcota bacterium]
MERAIHQYLSSIGREGGRKSRRNLDCATAREMVRVREARRAFARFYSRCFWSCDPGYRVTAADLSWVAEQLMRHGGRQAFEVGTKLCP